ncbi:hemerythrin domain-containing protein [Kitasatospora sp. NPDC097643]|uniref:hemerythrin domain-containing protein n=1 Tax=Kitasatospora sp. NPDC097643 TaxID=3157230 RepID=UPI003317CBA7
MNGAEGFPSGLCAEHRAVEAVLRRLDSARANGGPAPEEGLRLLCSLRRLLDVHLAAEEDHLYPLVRRRLPAGGALADAAVHTHATIRRLLERAADERLSSTEHRRCTAALLVVLRAHLRGEEERLFPALRARATAQELRRCARHLRGARAARPDAPVWGLPPGTGAIAAVRDHLTGHGTRERWHSP